MKRNARPTLIEELSTALNAIEEREKTIAELRQSLIEEIDKGKRNLQDKIRAESLNNAYLAIISAMAGVDK